MIESIPKVWPFEQAARLADRLRQTGKTEAVFETGYGPSGLPHIGTFGEVARTSWVKLAFTALTGRPSRLIAFSDDMDGLRKVPDNVPNQDVLKRNLGKPLTRIPDPFGTHESFGAHNNARLKAFLDRFQFDYEFASATDYYSSGRFDAAMIHILQHYDDILAVVLPTLGSERRATYSPFLPIHPETGRVMQVAIERCDRVANTVSWRDPDSGRWFETPITGGACKMQWKVDWAMRWHALGVDYEMSGKDLIDSVRLSSRICSILGSSPPIDFTYELFLDEHGQKISKSKGNGLSVEEWLRYAPPESLAQFMFNAPTRAKRLYFDVIPKSVDEYLANLDRASRAIDQSSLHSNPVWFIHGGLLPQSSDTKISFAMLLNLASVVNAENADILWGFIDRYARGTMAKHPPFLSALVRHAVAYYQDFVRPTKRYRQPDAIERVALEDLAAALAAETREHTPEALQTLVYDVGKRHSFPDLKAWFSCLYQVLLGQDEGPRFGGFIALYGVAETVELIKAALARRTAPA